MPDKDPKILGPLRRFYTDRPLPEYTIIEGKNMPEPYKSLLVHQKDMTPTLEEYHKNPLKVEALEVVRDGDTLSRLVKLLAGPENKIVEFGAIEIPLQPYPDQGRDDIVGCSKPLGRILEEYKLQHISRPKTYFEIEADLFIAETLMVNQGTKLYARRNQILTTRSVLLADVLEILPKMV